MIGSRNGDGIRNPGRVAWGLPPRATRPGFVPGSPGGASPRATRPRILILSPCASVVIPVNNRTPLASSPICRVCFRRMNLKVALPWAVRSVTVMGGGGLPPDEPEGGSQGAGVVIAPTRRPRNGIGSAASTNPRNRRVAPAGTMNCWMIPTVSVRPSPMKKICLSWGERVVKSSGSAKLKRGVRGGRFRVVQEDADEEHVAVGMNDPGDPG